MTGLFLTRMFKPDDLVAHDLDGLVKFGNRQFVELLANDKGDFAARHFLFKHPSLHFLLWRTIVAAIRAANDFGNDNNHNGAWPRRRAR